MVFKNVSDFKNRIKKILITAEEIDAAIGRAAKKIDSLYDGKPLIIVGILKGSFVFMADVCRRVTVPCEVGFMAAKSYFEGTQSCGEVKITLDLHRDIEDCHVVILEDIVDTGRTLNDVAALLRSRKPASLTVITLLDKPDRREVDFAPDISLFTIPDLFVVGYGLDCGEYYRNLPYIAEYGE